MNGELKKTKDIERILKLLSETSEDKVAELLIFIKTYLS